VATVAELEPGDLVTNGAMSAVFISRTVHPIWPDLNLVIWRLPYDDPAVRWSFDALSSRQEVGDVTPSVFVDRQARLRDALLGEDATRG
jgi:hypothetical protein